MPAIFSAILLALSVLPHAATPATVPPLVLELSADHPSVYGRTLTVTFRAQGKTDVYFDKARVRLEVQTSNGERVRYGCADKKDLSSFYDPVLLHPGDHATKFIDAHCYVIQRGVSYRVTAMLTGPLDQFRSEAPAGAMWIDGPLRSNTLLTPLLDGPR